MAKSLPIRRTPAQQRAYQNYLLNMKLKAQAQRDRRNPTFTRANPNSTRTFQDFRNLLGGNQQPQDPGGDPGGGGMPDAYYQQLQSQLMAQGAADKSQTRAAIQQALIGFGLVPEGFKDKLGALDDTTRALIEKNTKTGISGYARMLEGKSDAQKALINRLSASGLRRSGAKGYKLRRGQLDWDRQYQDAIAALLSDVGGRYEGYAANEGARQSQLLSALYSSGYSPQSSSPSPSTSPQTSPSTSPVNSGIRDTIRATPAYTSRGAWRAI